MILPRYRQNGWTAPCGMRGWRWAGLAATLALSASAAPLQFNRDVRPILSENCFHCHGQDEARREAKLRLDVRESAVKARDGIAAIVPGNPAESELVRRITAKEPTDIMPPPESHRTLTVTQIEMLRRWIAEGAEYQGHWAFISPRRPPVPPIRNSQSAIRNTIDAFIRARLAQEGLRSAEPA